jgi:hypothetical protein
MGAIFGLALRIKEVSKMTLRIILVLTAFCWLFLVVGTAWAGCDEAIYPHDAKFNLMGYFYDPDGYQVATSNMTPEECEEARKRFHLRGYSLQRQAEDKDLDKHQPYCKQVSNEAVFPNHESTEIYTLRAKSKDNLTIEHDFATAEECGREGTFFESVGAIKGFACIPGRGVRPERAVYKWALFVASTKNYEYVAMFTSYQDCKENGEQQAAHFDGNGKPMFECRLAVKDR